MSERRAQWAAAAALLALLIASILLASGLGTVPFHDGRAFDETEAASSLTSDRAVDRVTRGMGVLTWLLVPFAVLLILVIGFVLATPRGDRRRRTGRIWLGLVLVLIALAFATHNRAADRDREEAAEAPAPASSPVHRSALDDTLSGLETLAEAGEAEARATSALLLAAVAAIAVVTIAAVAIPALRRGRRAPAPAEPASAAETAAGEALDRLRLGRDAAGVVEVCYRDVMKALAQAARLDARTLTPRELLQGLASAGYEGASLVELTELFELVRYGGRPDALFAARARACFVDLAGPLRASGATAGG